jgi:hypothetical protein
MISNRELVVYLFAPIAGPGAEDAHLYLCRVWEGCRRELGMDQPIPATGLATEFSSWPPAGVTELGAAAGAGGGAAVGQAGARAESATLAACRRAGPGSSRRCCAVITTSSASPPRSPRRLIEAGRHEFPFNHAFRDLARRYGLPEQRGRRSG